ncbi:ABC transporter substrate-binding (seleno)protein SaoB [Desulfopila sp. IMCC35008]|uniref:ABC transporter substrate-binding (seleno)protein SaoB n=1 Tax=Desulfopila sp. IMCC35008 TaxID=2653858 RepID=UPI0013D0616E|nr:ABC transporter substrate-binding (seleno)protein SaoB [Desulfopila sp. IMCC35008]
MIVVTALHLGDEKGLPILVNIGAPGDTAGLLLAVAVEESENIDLQLRRGIETLLVNDCCAVVSQWAMSSESLDLALMCPDSALALVERDNRFEVVGPILMNAEVLVTKKDRPILSIGFAQGRIRHAEHVASTFKDSVAVSAMLPASLPYAYEKNVVDGVVVDFLTALTLNGNKTSLAGAEKHNISYVLVVRKSFRKSLAYTQLLTAIEKATYKLAQPDELSRVVTQYKNKKMGTKEIELWQKMQVRFVIPTSMLIASLKSRELNLQNTENVVTN